LAPDSKSGNDNNNHEQIKKGTQHSRDLELELEQEIWSLALRVHIFPSQLKTSALFSGADDGEEWAAPLWEGDEENVHQRGRDRISRGNAMNENLSNLNQAKCSRWPPHP